VTLKPVTSSHYLATIIISCSLYAWCYRWNEMLCARKIKMEWFSVCLRSELGNQGSKGSNIMGYLVLVLRVLIHGLSDLWFCLFLMILLIMSCWFCVLNMIQWATKLCVEVVEFFYYMSLFIYVSWVFYLLNIFTTYLYFFMWGCWIFLLSCWFCVLNMIQWATKLCVEVVEFFLLDISIYLCFSILKTFFLMVLHPQKNCNALWKNISNQQYFITHYHKTMIFDGRN